ncbi:hypothetical protein HK405_010660, partial [Cladochytrium tenue]
TLPSSVCAPDAAATTVAITVADVVDVSITSAAVPHLPATASGSSAPDSKLRARGGASASAAPAAPPAVTAADGAGPRSDFFWLSTDEPHAIRRRQMLKKYPQIRSLMRHEPLTAVLVSAEVALQFALAYLFRNPAWLSTWTFWVTAYIVGGTVTCSLLLSVHEITHFLAFRGFLANKILACVANLPVVLPFCVDFKRYHMDHHRFQGVDGVDGDLPTALEGRLLNSRLGKLFFCTFQILFYAIRPKMVATAKTYRMPRTASEWIFSWYALNYTVQFAVMGLVLRYWGLTSILYLAASVLLGGSLHPMAGHYLAEHYVTNPSQETYSYYGLLNWVAFNSGYHNEHHDFPNIPWTLLPELRKIAPEFYDMPQCKSWTWMIVQFIFTPSLGPYSRIKRKQDATAAEKNVMPATVDDVSAAAFVGKEDI